jgi:class 3 adenylate cyclase
MTVARLPDHPVLAAVAGHLERNGWAGYMADHEMRVVWISADFLAVLGETKGEQWYGLHVAEFTLSKEALAVSTRNSVLRSGIDLLPALIDHTPGGREVVRKILAGILGEEASAIVDQVGDRQDPMWASGVKWTTAEGMAPVRTNYLATELRDGDGTFLGTVFLFGSGLPFRLVSALARGDEEALERMARLAKPGRHAAAILFADLQSSGVLSRRLPSAVYFRVVRTLITAIDGVVMAHKGLVGRHAGDGVTSFFLSDDLGSASLAARAAIEAGREILVAVRDVAAELEGDTRGLVTATDFPINIGVHWGGSLYMGQLTGGRLEITALGDAVNECARIQESAREGQVLVSKTLVENLAGEDSAALDLDPDTLSYVTIGELPHASQKAVRDAGGIAVASL